MVIVDTEKLLAAIFRNYQCSSRDAARLANCAKDLDDRLQPVLDAWIMDDTVTDYAVNGVGCRYIMEKTGAGFLPALAQLDYFLKNPDEVDSFKRIPFRVMDISTKGDIRDA